MCNEIMHNRRFVLLYQLVLMKYETEVEVYFSTPELWYVMLSPLHRPFAHYFITLTSYCGYQVNCTPTARMRSKQHKINYDKPISLTHVNT